MSGEPFSARFLTSTADGPPLRVGVLVDGPRLERAAASILRDLGAASFVWLELVLLPAGGPAAAPSGGRRARTGLVGAAYAALDRRRTGAGDDPDVLEDVGPLLAGIPTIALDGAGLARVRAAALDVIVGLGSAPVPADLSDASRHGVWALRPGDDGRDRGPAGFRALVDGRPVHSVALVRLADVATAGASGASPAGEPGLVLDRATFAVDPTSLARTRRVAAYGSTHLIVRGLRLLHERGWDWLAAHRPPDVPVRGGSRPGRAPSDLEVLRWLAPLAARRLAARVVRLVTRADDVIHWRVAIRVGHPSRLIDEPADLGGFRWLESPRGHYYADPFVVERDGRRWLFVEDFVHARDAAVIACAELGPDGVPGPFREALRSSRHLSYPLVVQDGGAALLVPESAADGVVRAWRATEFPLAWAAAADLLPEAAVDTTIVRSAGRWWLFTTVAEPRGGAGMLLLFHAADLAGPWLAHPLNPVSQDVRTSRGGGSMFEHAGRLIRPSQDGSRGYGYRLTFNAISVLTPVDYAERPGPSVTPDAISGLLGLHTYNAVGDVEVIDGKVVRPRRSVA